MRRLLLRRLLLRRLVLRRLHLCCWRSRRLDSRYLLLHPRPT
ncbi:hypothetical protein [Herbidospora cretacea]|nr:hypothetical protein [Herbidospora cretacea]